MISAGLAVVVAGAAVVLGTGVLRGNGPAHVLTTPDKLGAYVRRPQLEKQMNAGQLQKQVITKSAGQAGHVVSAVYEDGASATSTKTPQMILFIGGNLSGVSASGFIASFTRQSKGAYRDQRGFTRRVGGVRQRPGQRAGQRRAVHLGRQRHVRGSGVADDDRGEAGHPVAGHPADGRARRQVGLAAWPSR